MNDLPPPQPALAAPRLRHNLTRVFTYADKRKAKQQAHYAEIVAIAQWRHAYEAWWLEHGWHEGADNPTVAFAKLQASRR